MLLIVLGGCTGNDVVSILNKKRITLDHLELPIDGDVVNEPPKVFSKIHVEYLFYVTGLSQNKHCPISTMLQKNCKIITH